MLIFDIQVINLQYLVQEWNWEVSTQRYLAQDNSKHISCYLSYFDLTVNAFTLSARQRITSPKPWPIQKSLRN